MSDFIVGKQIDIKLSRLPYFNNCESCYLLQATFKNISLVYFQNEDLLTKSFHN